MMWLTLQLTSSYLNNVKPKLSADQESNCHLLPNRKGSKDISQLKNSDLRRYTFDMYDHESIKIYIVKNSKTSFFSTSIPPSHGCSAPATLSEPLAR